MFYKRMLIYSWIEVSVQMIGIIVQLLIGGEWIFITNMQNWLKLEGFDKKKQNIVKKFQQKCKKGRSV